MMTDDRTHPNEPAVDPPGLLTTEPSPRTVLIRRTVSIIAVLAIVAATLYAIVDRLDPSDVNVAATGSGDESDPPTDTTAANAGDGTPAIDSEPAAPSTEVNVLDVAGADEDGDESATGTEPAGTRFVDLPTTRILDTRQSDDDEPAEPIPAGGSVAADAGDLLPGTGVTTMVLSVNVAMAQGPGPIAVSAGSDPVTAINVAAAGQMTTNMVLVPTSAGAPVEVTTAGGGHLVVDVVGYFEEAATAAAGRFVPVATQRIARLVTEVDGREAVVSPLANPALPASGVTSVLVRITADVGGEGGMVRLGEDLETLPNTMMWAATSGDDRTRQGVAVVPLSEIDELAFTYNGGSVLDVDVLGYFTDESALDIDAGLFVPAPSSASGGPTIEVEVAAGEPTTIDVAGTLAADGAAIGAVPVNVFATAATPGALFVQGPAEATPASATVGLGAGAPRFGFTVAEVGADGEIVVVSDVDATVTLNLPGYFKR